MGFDGTGHESEDIAALLAYLAWQTIGSFLGFVISITMYAILGPTCV
jgi:hypothetical protein